MPWVLAAVAALIVFLLVSRVRVLISYQETFRFEVHFWFFRILVPKPPSPKPVKQKKKRAKPVGKERAKPDLSFFLAHFSELFDTLKDLIAATGHRLVMDRLSLNLRIHEADAAATAIRYGQACAVVYTVTGFIGSAVRVRRHEIRVSPVFQEDGATYVAFSAVLSMSVFSIVTLGITRGPAVLKLIQSFLHTEKDMTLQKDGVVS